MSRGTISFILQTVIFHIITKMNENIIPKQRKNYCRVSFHA